MNKFIAIGNMCEEPNARTTQNGVSQSTFRIAVQRRFPNQQGVRESDFFTVVAWRQSADFANRYLHKGYKVAIEGSLQNRSYEKDGVKHYITEIIADSVENLTSRNDAQAAQNQDNPQPRQQNQQQTSQQQGNYMDDFEEVEDDSLPF